MLGKISRAAAFLSLIVNLRFQQGTRQIVDFVLSNPLIRPLQVPSELHRFAEIVASIRPTKVLEIGTFQGGTLCMFARLSAPRATIISIDLPGGNSVAARLNSDLCFIICSVKFFSVCI